MTYGFTQKEVVILATSFCVSSYKLSCYPSRLKQKYARFRRENFKKVILLSAFCYALSYRAIIFPEKRNDMKAVHVYMKGINGWGLFYKMEDCLVYMTMYSVLAREMKISVPAFSIMFNHTHALHDSVSKSKRQSFQRRLGIMFSNAYNAEYGRDGKLFVKPYGFSEKNSLKYILSSVPYVANNPVAGKMVKIAKENRWTLLAYYNDTNPFSEKLIKRNCRYIMKTALKVVDIYYEEGKYLNYACLRRIFHGLSKEERNQLIDYIVSKYNFLDYNKLGDYYGSMEKAMLAIDTFPGNEYELQDESGDHSKYSRMIALYNRMGYSGTYVEALSEKDHIKISKKFFERLNPRPDQVRKFLHQATPSDLA